MDACQDAFYDALIYINVTIYSDTRFYAKSAAPTLKEEGHNKYWRGRVVVRISGVERDVHALARKDRCPGRCASKHLRAIRPRLNTYLGRATRRSASAVIRMQGYRVGPCGNSSGKPAHLRSVAINAATA